MKIKFVISIIYLAFTCAASNNRYSRQRLLIRNSHDNLLDQIDRCKFDICENASSYPSNEIRRIVDQHQIFHSFFKGNVFETDSLNVGSRSGSDVEYFCQSRDVRIIPKVMKDIENIARVIVNVEEYQQILTFQVCENEENECLEEAPRNYKTKCEQKYNNIKLVTINVNNHVLEYRSFKIPTTCVCTYRKYF